MQALALRIATSPRAAWPDRPVPVVLSITDLDVGGAERALVALAMGLDRRRWAPSVVCLGHEGELASPLRRAGIPVRCLALDRRQALRGLSRVAATLRAVRPALAQSFLFHANVATRLAARIAGVPWVLGGLRVAEKRRNHHLALDRWTIRFSAGSVCVSEGVLRFAIEVGRLPADRLVLIPNGVDLAPFDRAKPTRRATIGVPNSGRLALFIGRLEAQKGLATLLDAAEIAFEGDANWHLAIVGEGPLGEALQTRTRAHPMLRERVHWLGRRSDVPGLLLASDLLVLPSLWEGMPNVVLEAMAARRAVIATAVEGSSELVRPGETGWLVNPGSSESLALALREAASDPECLQAMGRAGRVVVAREYAPGRIVAAYEDLWARLLGFAPPGECDA